MLESRGGKYTKNRTYRTPFTSAVRKILSGNPGALRSPRKKIEFVIGEMQFPGLTCTLQSLLSRSQFLPLPPVSRNITPRAPPTIFLYKFGQITIYEIHVFKKWENVPPWLRQYSSQVASDLLQGATLSLGVGLYLFILHMPAVTAAV